MLKRYLVAHDDSITEWEPAYVNAGSPEEAIGHYMQQIYSKDFVFREHVQDLRSFESFLGKLIYATCEDKDRFMDGDRTPAPETVCKKIRKFFADEPELGERFRKYLECEDASLIDDAIYEFIAIRDSDGVVAIEESSIRILEQPTSIRG
ncbi:hypothetical protein [Pseudomonas sp.]|uniref:hypothetical protein n=1 Tax=Pseudomonas sp. TaxID=306 RepID=UPI0026164DD1|nr:hypothetical protein [Pseudomonas sp.]